MNDVAVITGVSGAGKTLTLLKAKDMLDTEDALVVDCRADSRDESDYFHIDSLSKKLLVNSNENVYPRWEKAKFFGRDDVSKPSIVKDINAGNFTGVLIENFNDKDFHWINHLIDVFNGDTVVLVINDVSELEGLDLVERDDGEAIAMLEAIDCSFGVGLKFYRSSE